MKSYIINYPKIFFTEKFLQRFSAFASHHRSTTADLTFYIFFVDFKTDQHMFFIGNLRVSWSTNSSIKIIKSLFYNMLMKSIVININKQRLKLSFQCCWHDVVMKAFWKIISCFLFFYFSQCVACAVYLSFRLQRAFPPLKLFCFSIFQLKEKCPH